MPSYSYLPASSREGGAFAWIKSPSCLPRGFSIHVTTLRKIAAVSRGKDENDVNVAAQVPKQKQRASRISRLVTEGSTSQKRKNDINALKVHEPLSAKSVDSSVSSVSPVGTRKEAKRERTVRRLKNKGIVTDRVSKMSKPSVTPISGDRNQREHLALARFKELTIGSFAGKDEGTCETSQFSFLGSEIFAPPHRGESPGNEVKLSKSDLELETNRIPDSVVSLKGADMDGRRLSLTSANTTGNYLELYGKSAVWTQGHVSSISKNEGAGQRLRRLFREKRERGMASVSDKFTNNTETSTLHNGSKKVSIEPSAGDKQMGTSQFGYAFSEDMVTSGEIATSYCNDGSNMWSISNSVDPFKLIPGEYVVHRKYGVGKFLGIRNITVQIPPGGDVESRTPLQRTGYLFIEYADQQAKIKPEKARNQLYRYASPGHAEAGVKPPKLSRIRNQKGWLQREAVTKKHIRQLVVNQMSIYLQRLQCIRPPYVPPSEKVYSRFNDLFAYRLTPDQKAAVNDCYEDLSERDSPMDRIVIGDVGFGKTEVALRAIFRVFTGGGKIFVLAPTTVLAKQHAATLAARLRPFGASVELLSRNIKTSERNAALNRWLKGSVDVMVGTHILLNLTPEIYSRLNLLVIDEEQRFGVKNKDQITALKASVDVLTLSATPIPRTLHMAVSGFRDASLVTTPPPERRPINTKIMIYDLKTVRRAIQFELDRDGQIFYVVPKIQMIGGAMKRLRGLFPSLNVMEAHGQMKGEQLDNAMDKFASGKADVLLCTTIVESGLDIPNVNTIIIEDVHQFGLASLYQLRGRVGRAGRQAYAYMFHADLGDMRTEARERLLALEECCGLGEGFKLAERDMAIRGVGTIFGDKQSGEVDSVGADLYLELLYSQLKKIEKLKIKPLQPKDVKIINFAEEPTLNFTYLATPEARKLAHDSLAGARTLTEVDRVFSSLIACFGEADTHSLMVFNYHRLRALAGELGVKDITISEQTGVIDFTMDADLEVKEMLIDNLDRAQRNDIKVTQIGIRYVGLAGVQMDVALAQAVNALKRISENLPSFTKFL